MFNSVIRWIDYLFNIWPVAPTKIGSIAEKITKEKQNLAKKLPNTFISVAKVLKFCQILSH